MNGFIFDMDNTLLQSAINFYRMKKVVFTYLEKEGLVPADLEWEQKTASQLIEMGRKHAHFFRHEQMIWELIAEIETEGMRGAILTPGAGVMLNKLHADGNCLTILTNNARQAAIEALQGLFVADYFDYIAGREQMSGLKPSPSGVFAILARFTHIPKDHWVLIGDSWIDGKAANDAGIAFLAYQANKDELTRHGVACTGHIDSLVEILERFPG
jgi:phosphoglycolate phosphatase